MLKKLIDYGRLWFEKAMEVPSVNSRIVYLAHGLVVSLGTVALVVAFIIVQNKVSYPEMLMALGGCGGVAAASRMMTKLGDKKKQDVPDASDDVPQKG
jgi:hypothetical protein